MFDVTKIRKDFPMIRNHPDLIYFDNGATTFKPQSVIDTVQNFYLFETTNVHRGDYPISYAVSEKYDEVRKKAARFINAEEEEIVYTKGDTDGLNQIAYSFGEKILREGDVILTTETEHASSILPWFRMAKKCGAKIEYVPLGEEGQVLLPAFEKAMHEKVKVVVTTHVSNVLGHINPVREMAKTAHKNGSYIVVDAAQSVPHIPVDVKDLDCDLLAFSGHKMLAPGGTGILYGKKEILAMMDPLFLGGSSNARFDRNCNLILKKGPDRFEAGTPNIEGMLGLGAAIDYLSELGMENVAAHDRELRDYLVEKMLKLDNVVVYNPTAETGIISFNFKNIFAQDAAGYLAVNNICVRSGNHCAKIVKDVIETDDSIRASLYLYNTREEADRFVEVVKETTLEKCIDVYL